MVHYRLSHLDWGSILPKVFSSKRTEEDRQWEVKIRKVIVTCHDVSFPLQLFTLIHAHTTYTHARAHAHTHTHKYTTHTHTDTITYTHIHARTHACTLTHTPDLTGLDRQLLSVVASTVCMYVCM